MQEGFRPLIFLSKVVDITCYRQIYNQLSHMSMCMEDLDVKQPPKQGDKIMIETWLIPRTKAILYSMSVVRVVGMAISAMVKG